MGDGAGWGLVSVIPTDESVIIIYFISCGSRKFEGVSHASTGISYLRSTFNCLARHFLTHWSRPRKVITLSKYRFCSFFLSVLILHEMNVGSIYLRCGVDRILYEMNEY